MPDDLQLPEDVENKDAGGNSASKQRYAKAKSYLRRKGLIFRYAARRAYEKAGKYKQSCGSYYRATIRPIPSNTCAKALQWWRNFWGFWDVERGQLFFALVLTVATIAQWIVMDRGLEQTDSIIEKMQLEQRAWLGIKVSEPALTINAVSDVTITNFGDTPATLTFYYASQFWAGEPISELLEMQTAKAEASTDIAFVRNWPIAPSESVGERIGDFGEMTGMQKNLYFLVHIRYRDTFNEEHRTQALYQWGEAPWSDGLADKKLFLDNEYNYMK